MNVVSLFLISELRQSIDNPAVVPLVVAYVLGASLHGDIALSAASVFSVHGNGMFTVVSAYLMQSFIIVFLSVFIRGARAKFIISAWRVCSPFFPLVFLCFSSTKRR